MKKVKKLSIKQDNGNMSEALPIGVDASNVDMQNGSNAEIEIKNIKTKLDTIDEGANAYVLPVASNELGGIKDGGDLTVGEDGTVEVKDNSHKHTIANVTNLQGELDKKVPNTRKVNGHELKTDITLTYEDVQAIPVSEKGEPNGVATLDAEGQVPAAQLPSFVDNIWEGYLYNGQFYEDAAHEIPIDHQANHIYVDKTTNKTYRWSGSQFTEISPSLALGTTSSTAFRGDWGKIAYDHTQAKGKEFKEGFYKVTTNAQGHVTAVTEVTLDDITGLGVLNAQPSDTTPKVAAAAAKVGTEDKWARGDHVHPVQTSVSGNAGTATKLATARNLKVDLTKTAAKSFDGSAAAEDIGVTGILPVANGGTGKNNLDNVTVGTSKNLLATHQATLDLNTILCDYNLNGRIYSLSNGDTITNLPTNIGTSTKWGSFVVLPLDASGTGCLQILSLLSSASGTTGKPNVWIRYNYGQSQSFGPWLRVYTDDYHPTNLPVNPTDTSNINIWISDK